MKKKNELSAGVCDAAGRHKSRCFIKSGLLLATAISLVACSSSGGSPTTPVVMPPVTPPPPPPPPTPMPSDFETAEYQANFSLEQINVIPAYVEGGDGSGALVAIIDTGIDVNNPEFAGRIDSRSADLVVNGIVPASEVRPGGPDLQDAEGHGTSVASIIAAARNDTGVHGVAPEARLLVYRGSSKDDDLLILGNALSEGFDRAANLGADVLNLSLGSNEDGAREGFANLLNTTSLGDVVVTLAAGNDSLDDPEGSGQAVLEPEARGTAIVVGSVNSNNQLSSFSNRAGVAQEFYLVAPGEIIRTTNLVGSGASLVTFSGTSAATPHVAGAAALLRDLWPSLSAQQVVEILLESATDLGAAGTDAVYGRGLLNVGAALEPAGNAATSGVSSFNMNAGVSSIAFQSSPVFAGVSPDFGEFVFTDKYDRDYRGDFNAYAVSGNDLRVSLEAAAHPFTSYQSDARHIGQGVMRLRLRSDDRRFTDAQEAFRANDHSWTDQQNFSQNLFDDGSEIDAHMSAAFTMPISNGLSSTVAQGFSAREVDRFSKGVNALSQPTSALSRDGFDDGYLSQDDNVFSTVIGWQKSASLSFDLLAAQSIDSDLNVMRLGATAALTDRIKIRSEFGVRHEEGSVLDAAIGGVFASDVSASTYYTSVASSIELPTSLSLRGRFAIGQTTAETFGGVLNGTENLVTSQAALSLSKQAMFFESDRLTFTVSQPLQARAGGLSLEVATSYDAQADVFDTENRFVSLVPTHRSVDFEVGYEVGSFDGATLAVNVIHQRNAGFEVRNGTTALLRASFDF